MYNFKTLRCHNCSSVILNLPEAEVVKLDGKSFVCDCCGSQNSLSGLELHKSSNNEKCASIYDFNNVSGF